MPYRTYYLEYMDYNGHFKVYRYQLNNHIIEYSKFQTALKAKARLLKSKKAKSVEIKEIYY